MQVLCKLAMKYVFITRVTQERIVSRTLKMFCFRVKNTLIYLCNSIIVRLLSLGIYMQSLYNENKVGFSSAKCDSPPQLAAWDFSRTRSISRCPCRLTWSMSRALLIQLNGANRLSSLSCLISNQWLRQKWKVHIFRFEEKINLSVIISQLCER